MTLKDGYGFGGFSLAPPSKQHLSTPPPPPPGVVVMHAHGEIHVAESGISIIMPWAIRNDTNDVTVRYERTWEEATA